MNGWMGTYIYIYVCREGGKEERRELGSWLLSCCAVLCCAMLCYAMLCYAMLCYAMLCYEVCDIGFVTFGI